ncbi:VOC family protein [Kineococcus sp. T90]|nr:VOC family protein [Kineococcus indalonis]
MQVEHVLAVVPVREVASAQDWYARLFGREPDNRPMATLAEWRVTTAGWVQVFQDAGRAGTGLLNLAVADLDAAVAELRGRGLTPGPVRGASRGVRLVALEDPDGNRLSLVGGFRVEY